MALGGVCPGLSGQGAAAGQPVRCSERFFPCRNREKLGCPSGNLSSLLLATSNIFLKVENCHERAGADAAVSSFGRKGCKYQFLKAIQMIVPFFFLEGLSRKLLFSPCPWLSPSQGGFHGDGRKTFPRRERGPGAARSKAPPARVGRGGLLQNPQLFHRLRSPLRASLFFDGLEASSRVGTRVLNKDFSSCPSWN